MEGTTEFEEGEAFFCYGDDDEDNIDLDSLSYIDERIQNVLGHFQKDFEGGISAERLGAKFGDYGSFLPTYERSPPFRSYPKTPKKDYSLPKSPSNLYTAAAFHNSKPTSNMPSSVRIGTASHNNHPSHNLRAPSVDDSEKKNTGTGSKEETEKCNFKNVYANKSENLIDQRTLKLRIKVKSDVLAKKNAEIYSGLGLDISPSSSMGNSDEENEDMPPVSQEIPEESPSSIVQVMISFTIPGGVLISPLHDSLLYLRRKERVIGDSRPMSSLNSHQEHYSMSTDESDSFVGNGYVSKKRKVTVVNQSRRQRMNGNCTESEMALHMKKRLDNRTPDCREFLSNDLKYTPLSSSICDAGETAEVTGKAFEVSKEVNKDGVECGMVSIEAVKEDSLESISGLDFDKIEKQNTGNSFMKKAIEHKSELSQNNAFAISRKVKQDAVKCKVDQDIETEKCEIKRIVKVKSENKNKLKGKGSPGKVMDAGEKDSIGPSHNKMLTDRKSAGIGVTCKSKMHKIKPLKDNVRGHDRDSMNGKKSEWKGDEVDQTDGCLNKARINANLDDAEVKSVHKGKVKERQSGNKMANQLLAEPRVEDAPDSFPISENKPNSEMVPSSTAAVPQIIEEDWVCCDNCQTWRLLPFGLTPAQLPEKWLCSMLYWLPGMNRCNISEEETTKALRALYQIPLPEGQNNMQSHATAPETGVHSVDGLQLGLNHKTSCSDGIFGRGKKKHAIKEKAKPGITSDMHQLSNKEKNNAQGFVKNRSLIHMNHRPADSNRVMKSSSKHLSRLNNFIEKKHTPEEKEKQMNGGDGNSGKLKRMIEANQYKSGTPKKSKTEDVCLADKQLNPGLEFENVGLTSRNSLSTKACGKNMRKYDDGYLSDDLQEKLVVPVNRGGQAQLSSEEGSLNATHSSKKGLIKKRKLSEGLDHERRNNTLSLAATSSSSKVSGSNKARTNLEDVRGSPVESVTSSPVRTSNLDKRVLAVGDTTEKDNARKGGLLSTGSRRSLDIREGKVSLKMKEKVNKNNQESALSWQKSGKVTSLRVKEMDRSSGSKVSKDKTKEPALNNSSSKNGANYVSTVDTSHHISGNKTRNDVKNSSTKSKHKIDNLSEKNSWRHWSNETGKQIELKQKDTGNSILKADTACITNRKINSHQNLVQNFKEENKANLVQTGLRAGKTKVLSSSEGEVKRESLHVGSKTAHGLQEGDMSNRHPVRASSNGDVVKLGTNSVNVSCKIGVNSSSGCSAPDEQLSEPSPVRTKPCRNAFSILEEATKLKDSADHYKNSGFEFESNETYFKAALKFMLGASLLENCQSESSKHGETNQMQIYATTAKLFESCARKYERCKEMATAALAYKCMEVVYMRLVSCKHSSVNRDRHELQSTLQMVSLGESPSSSVSDIDNLNNLPVVDKANLTKGTNSHVPNNQVISAGSRLKITRLLDFTQNVSSAMEASRKCQSSFMVANLIMEEAPNRDCITSMRKVLEFSFQDVEELVHLVLTATKAIARAGLGGIRD